MLRNSPRLLSILLFLTACAHSVPAPDEHWDLTLAQRDSLAFALRHHFTIGYNFLVTADSLPLHPLPHALMDTAPSPRLTLHRGERIVVAEVVREYADSLSPAVDVPSSASPSRYSIMVARDQETFGWIDEAALLRHAAPCDPISRLLHFLSLRAAALMALCGLALCLLLLRPRKARQSLFPALFTGPSPYPALLSLSVSIAGLLHGSLHRFAPELWAHYYFYPTLNPFGQPLLLAAYLTSLWMSLLLLLANVFDTTPSVPASKMRGLVFLMALQPPLYLLFFLLAPLYGLAYLLLLFGIVAVIYLWRRHPAAPYGCGHCGKPLRRLGECPHCHHLNY